MDKRYIFEADFKSVSINNIQIAYNDVRIDTKKKTFLTKFPTKVKLEQIYDALVKLMPWSKGGINEVGEGSLFLEQLTPCFSNAWITGKVWRTTQQTIYKKLRPIAVNFGNLSFGCGVVGDTDLEVTWRFDTWLKKEIKGF